MLVPWSRAWTSSGFLQVQRTSLALFVFRYLGFSPCTPYSGKDYRLLRSHPTVARVGQEIIVQMNRSIQYVSLFKAGYFPLASLRAKNRYEGMKLLALEI